MLLEIWLKEKTDMKAKCPSVPPHKVPGRGNLKEISCRGNVTEGECGVGAGKWY